MIKAYRHPRPQRKLGWLLDHETVLLENERITSVEIALKNNLHIWADSDHLKAITRRGFGSAVLWRSIAIGWSPDQASRRRHPVRGIGNMHPKDPTAIMEGLIKWRDWLQSFGAAPQSSLGSSGFSLLKATLKENLWTSLGECPPLYFTIGGRQVSPATIPAHYRMPLVHSDMQAAYAQTLGAMNYGGQWVKLPWKSHTERMLDNHPDRLSFVRARVKVPDLGDTFPQLDPGDRGPLVVRPRTQTASVFWELRDMYPSGKTIQGCWTWDELKSALAAGCKIVGKPLAVWLHCGGDKVFAPWLEAVWRGREMGGYASFLAKATGNSTWGQFAIAKGQRKIQTATTEELIPMMGGNPSQRAFDLAENLTGRVRARLYRGMLDAGPQLITAHTDGLWTAGPPVMDWRHTADADELRICNAQLYSDRYREGEWDYTAAGQIDPAAFFEKTWARNLDEGRPTLAEWTTQRLARARRNGVRLITPDLTLAILPETRYSGLMTHSERKGG